MIEQLFYVRYFSNCWRGTYFNMENFDNLQQAKNYAKIVNGNVFIKTKRNHLESEFFKKVEND